MNSQTKQIDDFLVIQNHALSSTCSLLILEPYTPSLLRQVHAGQFVEVKIPSNDTFLRRPISICNIDEKGNLWLLVRDAGSGTHSLIHLKNGDTLNIIYPLGNGFNVTGNFSEPLLIGGGVGVAPLLYLGKKLKALGKSPVFLLGGRKASDLLLLDEFEKIGATYVSTEDGSAGQKGLVTEHIALDETFDKIFCCGPLPMMKAVARIANERAIDCEVSLENVMGCGLGACLCCVEKTTKGNVCVCSDGPVFNIKELLWQN